MEIRQLKYFISVAETCSFSEASRRCFLSQSAISQQIRALEDELQTTLFIRNPHKVIITESGEQLLPFAYEAIKSFNECQEHMTALRGKVSGHLSIGMSHFIEPYMRQAALLMMKQYPDLRLNMFYFPTSELNRMLIDRKIDLAFSINSPNEDEGIISEPAMTFHLRAVMRSTHPLAKKDKVTFDDMMPYGIVMPEMRDRVYNSVKKYLNVDIDKLNVRAVVNDPTAALHLVQDMNFITFLPAITTNDRPSFAAKRIEGLEMPIQSYMHRMESSYMKYSATEFLKYLHDYSMPYCESICN